MSAKRTDEGSKQIYAAAERWVDCALRTDGSLFTPDKAIWTAELLGVLHERFLDQPDESKGIKFLDKLESQLDDSPADIRRDVRQLMGEVLYVHYLPRALKVETKKAAVEKVLGRALPLDATPQDVMDGFQWGLMGLGPGNNLTHYQVGTLIESLEQWKKLASQVQGGLLKDEWTFKDFLFGLSYDSSLLKGKKTGEGQLHMLLHVLFPDTFEHILRNDKLGICKAKAFASFFDAQEPDVDRKVQQIRRTIEEKKGGDFDFYDEDIIPYWKPAKGEKPVEVFSVGDKGTQLSDDGLEALAAELYLPDDAFLKEIKSLLVEKGQVIFQGPPGTGKTYVARALARHLAGSAERVSLVQFHPSYAYEDFVQGFRPKQTDGGQVGFELRKGPLLEIAEKAERDKDNRYYLIIDEINRGNLATVFGELYFLLEYRGDAERIRLQYSDEGEKFALPENLFIIGTMNTADRSIAMVDLALRRRFYFVEFLPEEEPVKGVLLRWLEKNAPNDMRWVAAVVDKANELLKDSDAAIGPSYFMRPEGLTEDKVARIWKHSVLPYIEERLFNERDRLANFELENLRKAVSGGAGDGNVPGSDEGDGNAGGEGEA